ncbi:cyclic nucleotide-binding domain-containing protein [Aureimonas fodinaquatilis]|uniref:Cyclic nucleotide-binding domain-containing protein n=1 Tax=Aureimonas fodinaquatilis TaxID=2565783 RepID=A0A5B0DTC6_9HYPH|nr:cyclic nucleotide-binding domain-containing protein [Aureimonas fodinaquatilis]KAA0969673.1 cyclic nucleotide-binding domain-containing protein [Aureimonas fodinaquatilis]
MGLESDIALLGTVPLFANMTRDQLRLLAFGAEHRWLTPGEILFREDSRADAGFVVVSGFIELHRGRDEKAPEARLGPGAILGELSLIAETRRLSTAVSTQDSEVIRIGRQLFRRILEEYPEIAALIHSQISDELSQLTARIDKAARYFDD